VNDKAVINSSISEMTHSSNLSNTRITHSRKKASHLVGARLGER
jgi:hypothetical protein